ncbi:TVP38/TMEM64 family protein [Microvirga massiliensis]|uniref:TVP38/TMEM64 family protein n=1 Tax=Microvirga massiliensis TaxID=1033741 RepID=UPI00062B3000|nr:VTT domain-containing protein [Microvirga massiliensis]
MSEGEAGSDESGQRRILLRILPALVLVLGFVAFFASGAHRYLSLAAIVEHRDRLRGLVASHGLSTILVYMSVYVTAVALSVPGAVFLTILGGFLFGWLLGGALASLSATLGATALFLIARTSIGDALLRRAGPRVQALAAGFREDALSYLLFLRLLPIVPFWITNLASAFFGVPLRIYVLATQIGLIPATFAFAIAGSGLDSVIAAHREARDSCLAAARADCEIGLSVESLLTPEIVISLVVLSFLALAPVLAKRLARRFGSSEARRASGG